VKIYPEIVVLLVGFCIFEALVGHVVAQNTDVLQCTANCTTAKFPTITSHGSQPPAVPFDVPPKQKEVKICSASQNCPSWMASPKSGHCAYVERPEKMWSCDPGVPHKSDDYLRLEVQTSGNGTRVYCEDSKRVLLTDEAGERHCFALYLLGASHPLP